MHSSKFTKFPEVKLVQNISVSGIVLSYPLHLCFYFCTKYSSCNISFPILNLKCSKMKNRFLVNRDFYFGFYRKNKIGCVEVLAALKWLICLYLQDMWHQTGSKCVLKQRWMKPWHPLTLLHLQLGYTPAAESNPFRARQNPQGFPQTLA